jgi:hypothetical protein
MGILQLQDIQSGIAGGDTHLRVVPPSEISRGNFHCRFINPIFKS